MISINNNYNTKNLQKLYNNYSQIKSRIYTKQRILIMLNKKKNLIINLNNIHNKIYKYKLYIFHNSNKPYVSIYDKIKDLENKLYIIIKLLNKIEWEENLILSTLSKTKNNFLISFFKCFK